MKWIVRCSKGGKVIIDWPDALACVVLDRSSFFQLGHGLFMAAWRLVRDWDHDLDFEEVIDVPQGMLVVFQPTGVARQSGRRMRKKKKR